MQDTDILQPAAPAFTWDAIDTILLDMDGTLLDSYFDDYFWEEYVPLVFAEKNALSTEEAKEALLPKYKKVEKTLQWSDLDYWSEQLDLDIPSLKLRIGHLIQVHPHVIDFLRFITRAGKMVYLVTNAHAKTLDIKLAKTAIAPFFTRIVNSQEVGKAKEEPLFWSRLQDELGFHPKRTLLVDDNLNVLRAANRHGLGHLRAVARPSSRLPIRHCTEFASIVTFNELME